MEESGTAKAEGSGTDEGRGGVLDRDEGGGGGGRDGGGASAVAVVVTYGRGHT